MDSDIEFNDFEIDDDDDNDDTFYCSSKLSNLTPFPDECQNEVEGIEAFYKCFIDRYSACPAFYTGSLQEACESAFNLSVVNDRRPILVYIHHDKNLLSNIFCSNIFCSEIIIDYLLENYIVWPWDITHESNKTTLMNIWRELFSTNIPLGQCPMLIGIMRAADIEKHWSLTSRYRFTLLLENDKLTSTKIKLTRERLLNELISFKEQSNENEQNLLFDFSTTTGLSWDMIFEISRYLTLKDAIITFSPKILSLFQEYKTKLHLNEPDKPLIDTILKTIKPEQVASIQLNASRILSEENLSDLKVFTNVHSLIFHNIERFHQLYSYESLFRNLKYLSFYCDNEIDSSHLCLIISGLRRRIERLVVHLAAISYGFIAQQLNCTYTSNLTIKYFRLDIRHFVMESMNYSYLHAKPCFLLHITNLIKIMKNIQHIHFITNQYNSETLMDIDEWQSLIDECRHLEKVTWEVMGSIAQNKELKEKLSKIQNIRETIKFQIIFL